MSETATKAPKHKVFWTDQEVDLVTTRFLEKFLQHPFEPITKMAKAAQVEVLEPHRHRNLVGIPTEFMTTFGRKWKEFITNHAAATAEQEVPEPIIIEVERTKPVTVTDILEKADLSTLIMAIVYKYEQGVHDLKNAVNKQTAVLEVIASRLGANPALVPNRDQPRPKNPVLAEEALHKFKPWKVMVIGPTPEQYARLESRIQEEVKEGKLDISRVDLRFIDKTKHSNDLGAHCEVLLMTRFVAHKMTDQIQSNAGLTSNRVLRVGNEDQMVKHLRDINSWQR